MNVTRTTEGKLRRRAAIGIVGLAVLGGGGAAVAASTSAPASTAAQTSAIATDAAGQLNVTPAALTAAIKKAMTDQIEAQVTAGTLTKAQATTMEARLATADAPLFALGGGRGDHGHGIGGHDAGVSLDAAATYIGVTTTDLRTQLDAGKTLAAIATANGKTAAGLKAALTTSATTNLDAAVTAGTLTAAQEKTILANLPARLDSEINEVHTGDHGHSHGGGTPPVAPSTVPATP